MKKFNFDIASFLAGICITTWVVIAVFFAAGGNININGSAVKEDTSETASTDTKDEEKEEPNWVTNELKRTITAGDKKVTFYAPKKFYSISDQYIYNMGSYYGNTDLKSDSFYVVGDNEVSSSATTVISANTISDIKSIMKQLYGDDYSENSFKEAIALTYMKTGKLPKDAPDNCTVDELDKIKVGDVTYSVYEVNYDTDYKTGESTDNKDDTKDETTTVHTQNICAYSDTDDVIEIMVYQEVFDKEKAVSYIKEFVGAK